MANAYCDRLGITPPRLLDVAIGPSRKHLDALVLVLLAKGGPMDLEEIVEVLAPMWDGTPRDLRVTLQKAWAGREPVVKDAGGRYALDLESRRMNRFLVRLGLRQPPPSSRPPPFVPPGPGAPLTDDELRACFVHGCPAGVSGARFAAAVLDMVGRPLLPSEVAAVGEGWTVGSLPEPRASPRRTIAGLVVQGDDGRLVLNPAAAAELAAMRNRIRALALPRTRAQAERAWHREHQKKLDEERAAKLAARLAALPPESEPAKPSKIAWRGTVVAVQPRIRMTRSFDQRSHTYLGYVLRIQGVVSEEAREFVVAVGPAAHEKHQFRVGDEVSGEGWPVEDPKLETADIYKVSGLEVGARGPTQRSTAPPYTGIPPTLEEYRARGHRRLAALTYTAKCTTCVWGCEMAVEMIIDPWKPSKPRYRRETFCYGPKACRLYAAGPARKVPGRKGMSWTEKDWVDEDATGYGVEGDEAEYRAPLHVRGSSGSVVAVPASVQDRGELMDSGDDLLRHVLARPALFETEILNAALQEREANGLSELERKYGDWPLTEAGRAVCRTALFYAYRSNIEVRGFLGTAQFADGLAAFDGNAASVQAPMAAVAGAGAAHAFFALRLVGLALPPTLETGEKESSSVVLSALSDLLSNQRSPLHAVVKAQFDGDGAWTNRLTVRIQQSTSKYIAEKMDPKTGAFLAFAGAYLGGFLHVARLSLAFQERPMPGQGASVGDALIGALRSVAAHEDSLFSPQHCGLLKSWVAEVWKTLPISVQEAPLVQQKAVRNALYNSACSAFRLMIAHTATTKGETVAGRAYKPLTKPQEESLARMVIGTYQATQYDPGRLSPSADGDKSIADAWRALADPLRAQYHQTMKDLEEAQLPRRAVLATQALLAAAAVCGITVGLYTVWVRAL